MTKVTGFLRLLNKLLKRIVNTLPEIEKTIILKHFWQDCTLEITPGRVSQLKKLAIQHITEELRFTD